MLGLVGVGAGDEHAHVGDLAARGPHLLAVDDPLVAVLDRPRLQAGEVGAGAGLGEQLAPGLLAGDDVLDEGASLLVVTVVDDGRARPAGDRGRLAGRWRRTRRCGSGHGVGVVAVEALAVPLLGPHGSAPARQAEAVPPLLDGDVRIPVLVEPVVQLFDDLGFAAIRGAWCGVRHCLPLCSNPGRSDPLRPPFSPKLDPSVKFNGGRGPPARAGHRWAPRRRRSPRRAAPSSGSRRPAAPGVGRRQAGRRSSRARAGADLRDR